jgi:hypothetical protein
MLLRHYVLLLLRLCGNLQEETIESTRVRSVPRNSMDSMAALEIER